MLRRQERVHLSPAGTSPTAIVSAAVPRANRLDSALTALFHWYPPQAGGRDDWRAPECSARSGVPRRPSSLPMVRTGDRVALRQRIVQARLQTRASASRAVGADDSPTLTFDRPPNDCKAFIASSEAVPFPAPTVRQGIDIPSRVSDPASKAKRCSDSENLDISRWQRTREPEL